MKKVCFLVVMLGLGGCSASYFNYDDEKVIKSHNGVKLVVPAPLTNDNLSDFYTLPEQTQQAKISIIPPS